MQRCHISVVKLSPRIAGIAGSRMFHSSDAESSPRAAYDCGDQAADGSEVNSISGVSIPGIPWRVFWHRYDKQI